jgi:hypothetical protein
MMARSLATNGPAVQQLQHAGGKTSISELLRLRQVAPLPNYLHSSLYKLYN